VLFSPIIYIIYTYIRIYIYIHMEEQVPLIVNRSLLSVYGARLSVCRARLSVCRAHFSAYGLFRVYTGHFACKSSR